MELLYTSVYFLYLPWLPEQNRYMTVLNTLWLAAISYTQVSDKKQVSIR